MKKIKMKIKLNYLKHEMKKIVERGKRCEKAKDIKLEG